MPDNRQNVMPFQQDAGFFARRALKKQKDGRFQEAVVLLRRTADGKVRVTANDPGQDPKRESVTLGRNGKTYKVRLPAGVYCGQPVTVDPAQLKPLDK